MTRVYAENKGDAVRAFLAAHGLAPERIEAIPTGKFNDSYFADLPDGRSLVVRVAPPHDAGFLFYERGMMAQEPGIHRLLRQRTDIPVAEIPVHDDSRAVIDRDALVMSRLPGSPMSGVSLTSAATDRAMEQVGRHLRDLHENCQDSRYGYLGEHGCMEPCGTWPEAFEVMWGKLLDDIVGCGIYSEAEGQRAKHILAAHREAFDRPVPSCLLHMDIWAQNILVDRDGRVTGIVDWDRALWGDVEIEFAVLDYCGVSTDAFWHGYGRPRDNSPEARVRHAFYYLYEVQKYIVIRVLRSGSRADALRYREYAWQILSELEP